MKNDKIEKKLKSISKYIPYTEDIELNKKYSSDWRGRFSKISLGVIFPKTTKEVSKIVKLAKTYNIKLIFLKIYHIPNF